MTTIPALPNQWVIWIDYINADGEEHEENTVLTGTPILGWDVFDDDVKPITFEHPYPGVIRTPTRTLPYLTIPALVEAGRDLLFEEMHDAESELKRRHKWTLANGQWSDENGVVVESCTGPAAVHWSHWRERRGMTIKPFVPSHHLAAVLGHPLNEALPEVDGP